ncbi:MAG: hypothetical protein H7839_23970 [Magnetococcus sp. YQC-5]
MDSRSTPAWVAMAPAECSPRFSGEFPENPVESPPVQRQNAGRSVQFLIVPPPPQCQDGSASTLARVVAFVLCHLLILVKPHIGQHVPSMFIQFGDQDGQLFVGANTTGPFLGIQNRGSRPREAILPCRRRLMLRVTVRMGRCCMNLPEQRLLDKMQVSIIRRHGHHLSQTSISKQFYRIPHYTFTP